MTSRAAWARRAIAMLTAVITAVSIAGAAWAGPTPAPGPTPHPSPGPSKCVNQEHPDQVRWCFDWITPGSSSAGSSPWLTVCSKAKTTDEQGACDAASLTLDSPAPDNTASVLQNSQPDRTAPLVRCDFFTDKAAQDSANATRWNAKRDRCVQLEALYLSNVYVPKGQQGDDQNGDNCASYDIPCRVAKAVKDAIASGIRSGIQGLVDITVQAMAWMLGRLAELVFDTTSLSAPDDAFYWTYNQIAGALLFLVFVFFLISTIINGLRFQGPGPVATLGGLVRAVLGITFAGGIAWTITKAWDEATIALIERNSTRQWDPSGWITAMTALSGGAGTAFFAFVIALFAVIGLVLLFIFQLFRGLLSLGAALFGSMAMTGQVMAETRHWGRRWFWTVNALASSKFFIAGIWIYGSRAAYESNSMMTALKALLMIWLMVIAPGVLLRLTTMFDGYLSDVNAGGLLGAAGHAAAPAIGSMVGQVQSLAGGGGGGDGGPGDAAAGLMNANSTSISTNPAKTMGEAAGLGDGAGKEAADAVNTGQDGGKVGDPSQAADGAATGADEGGQDGHDDGGHPNAAEAEATQVGSQTARQDLSSGQITAPGDPGGADGALPVTPQAADGAAGSIPGVSAADGGAGAGGTGAGGTGGAPGAGVGEAASPGGADSPGGGDSAGAASSGAPSGGGVDGSGSDATGPAAPGADGAPGGPTGAAAPASGIDSAGPGATSEAGPTAGDAATGSPSHAAPAEPPGGGQGGAGAGGADGAAGAAGAAAEIPIVPL